MISVEQMCRDLLEFAVAEGIVIFNKGNYHNTNQPQEMTSGDLCGMANLLDSYLRGHDDDEWRKEYVRGIPGGDRSEQNKDFHPSDMVEVVSPGPFQIQTIEQTPIGDVLTDWHGNKYLASGCKVVWKCPSSE